MLKRLLAVLLSIAVLSPSVALAHDRYYYNNHYRNTDWVAPLIGGIIIGGAIASQNRYYSPPSYYYTPPSYYSPPRVYSYPSYQYPVQPRCVERWVTGYDNWGNRYQTLVRECF